MAAPSLPPPRFAPASATLDRTEAMALKGSALMETPWSRRAKKPRIEAPSRSTKGSRTQAGSALPAGPDSRPEGRLAGPGAASNTPPLETPRTRFNRWLNEIRLPAEPPETFKGHRDLWKMAAHQETQWLAGQREDEASFVLRWAWEALDQPHPDEELIRASVIDIISKRRALQSAGSAVLPLPSAWKQSAPASATPVKEIATITFSDSPEPEQPALEPSASAGSNPSLARPSIAEVSSSSFTSPTRAAPLPSASRSVIRPPAVRVRVANPLQSQQKSPVLSSASTMPVVYGSETFIPFAPKIAPTATGPALSAPTTSLLPPSIQPPSSSPSAASIAQTTLPPPTAPASATLLSSSSALAPKSNADRMQQQPQLGAAHEPAERLSQQASIRLSSSSAERAVRNGTIGAAVDAADRERIAAATSLARESPPTAPTEQGQSRTGNDDPLLRGLDQSPVSPQLPRAPQEQTHRPSNAIRPPSQQTSHTAPHFQLPHQPPENPRQLPPRQPPTYQLPQQQPQPSRQSNSSGQPSLLPLPQLAEDSDDIYIPEARRLAFGNRWLPWGLAEGFFYRRLTMGAGSAEHWVISWAMQADWTGTEARQIAWHLTERANAVGPPTQAEVERWKRVMTKGAELRAGVFNATQGSLQQLAPLSAQQSALMPQDRSQPPPPRRTSSSGSPLAGPGNFSPSASYPAHASTYSHPPQQAHLSQSGARSGIEAPTPPNSPQVPPTIRRRSSSNLTFVAYQPSDISPGIHQQPTHYHRPPVLPPPTSSSSLRPNTAESRPQGQAPITPISPATYPSVLHTTTDAQPAPQAGFAQTAWDVLSQVHALGSSIEALKEFVADIHSGEIGRSAAILEEKWRAGLQSIAEAVVEVNASGVGLGIGL